MSLLLLLCVLALATTTQSTTRNKGFSIGRFTASAVAAALAANVHLNTPTPLLVSRANAETAYRPNYELNDILRLKYGLREVTYLIDNWEDKTQTCNFGEIQRDILLNENKEKLMKAAAKGSLIDYTKSGTIDIMCKRDPQVVRAFLGLMPEKNDILFQADKVGSLLIYIHTNMYASSEHWLTIDVDTADAAPSNTQQAQE